MRNELGEEIVKANLVISGGDAVLVRDEDEIIDLIQRGQGVLNVLPLGGVKAQLDSAIVDLFPGEGTDAGVDADAGVVSTAQAT
jgi:hypothetical protein